MGIGGSGKIEGERRHRTSLFPVRIDPAVRKVKKTLVQLNRYPQKQLKLTGVAVLTRMERGSL
jgi:hypothetical protein